MASKLIFLVTWFFLIIHKVAYYFMNISKNKVQPISIYSDRKYAKYIDYQNKKDLYLMLKDVVLYLLIGLLAFFDGYKFILNLVSDEFLSVGLFLVVILVVEFVEDLIFNWIINFKIEKEYKYNFLEKKEFFIKLIKELLIAFITLGSIFLYIMLGKMYINKYYILIAFILSGVVLFVINRFSKNILEKLFVLEDLEDGEIKQKIIEVANKLEININRISLVKKSKDDYNANAMCIKNNDGLDIVLFEQLIEDLSVDEVVSICIHEMAHYKKQHLSDLFIFNLSKVWLLILLFVVFDEMHLIGFTNISHINSCATFFLVYEIVYEFIMIFVNMIINKILRNYEYDADSLVVELGYSEAFYNALIYLAKENIQDLNPTDVKVIFEYDHPTVIQRLDKIKEREN